MASQRLTLYDIVVDLLPGVTAILLFALLLPASWVRGLLGKFPLGSALVVLALGYVVGRLIHAMAARPATKNRVLGGFDRGISERIAEDPTKNRQSGRSGGPEPLVHYLRSSHRIPLGLVRLRRPERAGGD